jgi:hypothetical protein
LNELPELIIKWADQNLVLSVLFLCLVGFLCDFFYAKYTQAAAECREWDAANWSLLLSFFWIFLTLSVVEKSLIHILSYFVGGYLGTYLGVKKKDKP